MGRISNEKRKSIIQLDNEGYSQRAITKMVNVSRQAIQALLQKFRVTGTIEDRVKSVRPLKTSVRERRCLVRLSKSNHFLSAAQLNKRWLTSKPVSTSSVKNILRKYGLFGRCAARKPLLTKVQKKKRIQWCRNHKHWSVNNGRKVIFSDECRIELHPNRRQHVRREVSYRYKERYTAKTMKFGVKSLMVWGAIKANGDRFIVRCIGNVNTAEHQRILGNGFVNNVHPDEIFIQDGATCHTALSTSEYLHNHGICVVADWPPQSPDLNIIEHMWAKLKRELSQRHMTTLDDMWENCQQVWQSIPNEYIKRLYETIPIRIQAVLRSKGAFDSY
jgi:transposase